jgi:hypothetical protein
MKRNTVLKSIRLLSLLLLVLSFSLPADAQRRGRDDRYGRDDDRYRRDDDRWERLGDARVDGNRDHDTIRVKSSGRYRAIRFFVQGGDIEIQRVIVHFDNGGDAELQVQDRIRDGRTTRGVDLPGGDRRIRSVEFWYSKENWNRNKPQLVLYGRR